MTTTAISDRSPNTRFCFGQRVRVVAGFYRGSVCTIVGQVGDSLRSYVVTIRYPWPWILFYRAQRLFIREADLEAI